MTDLVKIPLCEEVVGEWSSEELYRKVKDSRVKAMSGA